MTKKQVVLKPGKEKAVRNRHHWIFSGAVLTVPDFTDGDILPVFSSQREFLGQAYFNSKTSILGRMITFSSRDPLEEIRDTMSGAWDLRKQFFDFGVTDAFRCVNGEGDFLPGLVIDKYCDVIVFQISTLGMDRLRPYIVGLIKDIFEPKVIYEKSVQPSRKEEGLKPVEQFHLGNGIEEVEIKENRLRFMVSITEGQKTGFFLDQREMRSVIQQISSGKRVLNCFSYTGGFSVYAAAGGAKSVVSLDISEKAVAMGQRNLELNHFSGENYRCLVGDVFEKLRSEKLDYDLVILDPPAFAKKQRDVNQACRGYKDINRLAMLKMPPQSVLLTCSCSYHVDAVLFRQVIFQAAVEAKRKVRILGFHRQAADHVLNLCHPEGDYLKSLLLYVD